MSQIVSAPADDGSLEAFVAVVSQRPWIERLVLMTLPLEALRAIPTAAEIFGVGFLPGRPLARDAMRGGAWS